MPLGKVSLHPLLVSRYFSSKQLNFPGKYKLISQSLFLVSFKLLVLYSAQCQLYNDSIVLPNTDLGSFSFR